MTNRKLVSRKDLKVVYGIPYSHQHIRRLELDGKFPNRITLGQCRVAWLVVEVEEWIDTKIASRGGSATPS